MNHEALQQKLATLAAYPNIEAETLQRFGEIIGGLNEMDLYRMNPLGFAEFYGLPQQQMIDLFIHAAKVGIFDFNWNMLCMYCGGIADSHGGINDVQQEHFYCSACAVNFKSALDDRIEISFTINPSIQKLQLDPFADLDSYRRSFFTRSLAGKNFLEQVGSESAHFISILADQTGVLEFTAVENTPYRVFSAERHATLMLSPDATAAASMDVNLLDHSFSPQIISVAPGTARINIRNLNHERVGMALIPMPSDCEFACSMRKEYVEYYTKFNPFLSAKMLLNQQSFRELYRVQTLNPNLKLNIHSLTILFTDLRGSTDLYDRTGDVFAYNIIQEHFKLLIKAVRAHSGAIVKTMGDAIMATFSTPLEGVLAAIDMMQEIKALNERIKPQGYEIGLKIGLHEGPSLAVNADERLDYFGQAINIAARVQHLAKSDEIWLTDQVYQTATVMPALASKGYQGEKKSVMLKGVGQAAVVHRFANV